jgi:ankyrin repeat protein
MANSDAGLRRLVAAIASQDVAECSKLLAESPELARARFEVTNATRLSSTDNFIAELEKYIYRGDTALHFAAAAHNEELVRKLIADGADVRAKNQMGDEPLHAAAIVNPNASRWNQSSQVAAITALVEAGADPNAVNKLGVSPLHKAVRTRCAEAVRILLASGADAAKKNKRGSNALALARTNSGRGGSGSPEAKAQQLEIIHLLERPAAPGR